MRPIEDVDIVSDGIIVRFGAGLNCYFSAAFLLESVGRGTNQVFLDNDPSPATEGAVSSPLKMGGPTLVIAGTSESLLQKMVVSIR